MINISYFYDLLEPADLYFMPMPARTALPPNANLGLSDWSYWSGGLIYVSGSTQHQIQLHSYFM